MRADAQISLGSELTRLRLSIDRAAAATEITLTAHLPADLDDDPRSPLAQQKELCRQLAALRERAALAESRNEDPRGLRGELATLLFFANTLRADADEWRATLEDQIKELKRRRTAARQELERLAAEHDKLVRRRDALRSTIVQTAGRVAQNRGECRNTLPVFTLDDGLTLCSVSVSWPRRGLRSARQWLVTLDRSHDVLVRRE